MENSINYKNEEEVRLEKLNNWSKIQKKYPDKFKKTHNSNKLYELNEGVCDINFAGRIMFIRNFGKMTFLDIQDFYGTFQIILKEELLTEFYDFYIKNLDIGDIIGVSGEIFITKTQKKSLLVQKLILLTKCLHPLPDKFHGLKDIESKQRQRYLDILMNEETKNRFKFRYNFINKVKEYLNNSDFIEVETPILQKQASGALATPFSTHHKALNLPLFLRIAPETYLKRLMAGGYERIYEIGKNFRNEGIDTSHLQEFTMLEFYAAFWNYEDNIIFIQNLFKFLFKELNLPIKITYEDNQIDFSDWKKITYSDLFYEYTKLNLKDLLKNEELMHKELSKFLDISLYKSQASLIDAVYKKLCRPNLINPTIITNQPAILGPLARLNDDDEMFSDRFQLVINGLEVVNSYSELVDPMYQREILIKQKELKNNGEEEAMEAEEDFLLAMEYAMPPMSGVGIGIDRLIALLTNSSNLREVIFFPNIK